jgi:hypothetical protein
MDELLQYIQIRHEDNKEQLDAASELLEYLYFVYIKPPFKCLRQSEEYRVAQDLLKLKKALNTNKLDRAELRTVLVRNLIDEYEIASPLTREDTQTIENNILGEYRYYVTAAFIADIVSRTNRAEYLKWVVTAAITLLAAVASFGWLFGSTP